jgi:hypothetical protein
MTLQERAANYARAFPDYPPLVVSANGRWLYGVWKFGQNYKGSGYYGSYPPSYLERVRALFPEAPDSRVLHIFSGSLEPDNPIPGVRVDIKHAMRPDVCGDAHRLPFIDGVFDIVIADTIYGPSHAKKYGTRLPDRKKVMRELARVTRVGGNLVWLDTKMPQFRKLDWHEWGNIGAWRSTNHDVRGVTCFRRAA